MDIDEGSVKRRCEGRGLSHCGQDAELCRKSCIDLRVCCRFNGADYELM